jgi:polyisoprenoid-binding protein YceI
MTFVVPSLAADYKLDSAHSSIIFKAKHLDIGYIYGMFLEYSGSVTYNPEKPKNTTFDVTVQTDSVFTNHRKRDNHLKSPDFFNAKQYPEITFESSSVEAVNDSTLRISADLTIRGVTESVTTDVKLTGSGKGPQGNFRRGFKSTFTINRLDYNVDFMPDSLSKEIPVTITGELIRQ